MTNEATRTLVLKSQEGDYFILPPAALERGRVPAERKAEVERLIAEAQGDTRGYAEPVTTTIVISILASAIWDFYKSTGSSDHWVSYVTTGKVPGYN